MECRGKLFYPYELRLRVGNGLLALGESGFYRLNVAGSAVIVDDIAGSSPLHCL